MTQAFRATHPKSSDLLDNINQVLEFIESMPESADPVEVVQAFDENKRDFLYDPESLKFSELYEMEEYFKKFTVKKGKQEVTDFKILAQSKTFERDVGVLIVEYRNGIEGLLKTPTWMNKYTGDMLLNGAFSIFSEYTEYIKNEKKDIMNYVKSIKKILAGLRILANSCKNIMKIQYGYKKIKVKRNIKGIIKKLDKKVETAGFLIGNRKGILVDLLVDEEILGYCTRESVTFKGSSSIKVKEGIKNRIKELEEEDTTKKFLACFIRMFHILRIRLLMT